MSQALANGRLEGWDPTRDEVADLIDLERGVLSFKQYKQRVIDRAREQPHEPPPADAGRD